MRPVATIFRSVALAATITTVMTCAVPFTAGASTDIRRTAIVSTCAPTGSGSLSDAIANAVDGTVISIRANCTASHPIAPTSALLVTKSLTIIGREDAKTTISGSAMNSDFALLAVTGPTVSLKNLNFIHLGEQGTLTGIESISNLSISGCTFSGGSGVSLLNGGSASITNTTFSKNSSFLADVINYLQSSRMSLNHVTFDQEHFAFGGPLFNLFGALSINESRFTNNSGGQGGAVTTAYGAVTISDSLFANNASTREGGAIYSKGSEVAQASLSIEGSTFVNNTGISSSAKYPGIWTDFTTLTIRHTTFNAGDDR